MRKNLKIFRVYKDLSQEKFAKKIGYSAAEYSCIETGKNNPRPAFWRRIKSVFRLSDETIYMLQSDDKKTEGRT